jgi:RimJ/RimL family protein N-acetyltransferase
VDVAFERLLTPRLVIRRFVPADAPAFSRYRSIPEVARFQSWSAPYPLEQAQAFVGWLADEHPDAPGEWFQLAIAPRDRPTLLIGDCGFRARGNEPAIADIGFTLDPAVQGNGYATEAIGEVLRYLFEDRGKHKVAADCDTRNERSWRLLERLGFEREGELRDAFRDPDGWASEYLYGLLAPAWVARREGASSGAASAGTRARSDPAPRAR